MAKLTPAIPAYGIGEFVAYTDHQGRRQTGEVYAVEASWRWGVKPLIIYTVGHPTYRGKRHYTSAKNISRRITRAALTKDTQP